MRSLQSMKQSPKRLWAYLVQYICGRRQITALSASTAMGRTGFELVKGYTPDISLYLAHDWYDSIWWFDLQDKSMKLGRWLGPAGLQFGGGDCHFVITSDAKIHITNSTSPVDPDCSQGVKNSILLMDKDI